MKFGDKSKLDELSELGLGKHCMLMTWHPQCLNSTQREEVTSNISSMPPSALGMKHQKACWFFPMENTKQYSL